MKNYLFVYGTLRKEFENQMAIFLQNNANYWRDGVMEGELYDVGTYPAALYEEGAPTVIQGNIFELTGDREEIFRVLDLYEGVEEDLYIRVIRPIIIEEGEERKEILSWVYLFNSSTYHLRLIQHGDYHRYLTEHR
jgi:gamma-glutamylcyclotransferase (GGCT)/AIG2-like uncharacterized protein YtfP